MKNSHFKLVIYLFLSILSYSVLAQKEEVCYNPNLVKDTSKKSIKSIASGKINAANFTIAYHSPGVRKRVIWGGLVPYGEVWVTGAHDATTISFDKPVIINNVTIPAGKYAFFTVPDKKEWTVIINKNWEQHLTNEYEATEDVVRIKVRPLTNKHLERLQYFIEPQGNIAVAWEKIKIKVPVTVKK